MDSFPITGLRGGPPSRKALEGMDTRCKRMPENEEPCHRLYQQLIFLHDFVLPLKAEDPSKRQYIDVIVRLIKIMRRTPLLLRLANSEALMQNLKVLQLQLDQVQKDIGQGTPDMTLREEQWDNDRAQQYQKLQERSPEMVTLKQETFDRVSRYAQLTGLQMFAWFIPIDNVEYEDEVIGERGTFGDVCRGTWMTKGKRLNVVVKRLFPELSANSDQDFLRQLELWSSIPEDRHILKLFGGSHVSSPQFYVCEDAHNGSLDEFLEGNSEFFWQMFLDVAEGIKVLHSRNIFHGGLKCSNILVGADYTAKLTDFGFSSVRSLSAGLSEQSAKAAGQSIRWKPKEVLEEVGDEEPQYASDIYSLGMCMIEALSREPPFGMNDEPDVMEFIMQGKMPDKPEDVSGDTWDLITRISCTNPKKRLSLDEVLMEFGARAAEERKLHPVPRPVMLEPGPGSFGTIAA
ncbi:hypothetical protein BBO99_00003651 [Phytophthora kernoviae]|uniref:Protein kinase domain-containing protein n=1 Tax=Phytophthora kernoviae TaxID=325452 RepID=A0A3R7MVT6_9STRA|nr:hypothetical protein BBI17_003680 [Phytophthora kernoviae]RLN81521.1 hypothetical protein BBO99_00003651 [Phytophthora kernoviae]